MKSGRNIEIYGSNIPENVFDEFTNYIVDNAFDYDANDKTLKYNADYRYKFMRNNGFMDFLRDKCGWKILYDIDFVSLKVANKEYSQIIGTVNEIVNLDPDYYYNHYVVIKTSSFTMLVFVVIGKKAQDLFLDDHLAKIHEKYGPMFDNVNLLVDNVKADLSNLEVKQNEANQKLEGLLNEFKNANSALISAVRDDTIKSLSDHNTQFDNVNKLLADQQVQNDNTNKSLLEHQAILDTTSQSLSDHQTKLNDAKNKYDELNNQLTNMAQVLNDMKSQYEKLSNDLFVLTTEKNKILEGIVQIKELNSTTSKTLEDNTNNLKNLEADNETLRKTVKDTDMKVEELISIVFPHGKELVFLK